MRLYLSSYRTGSHPEELLRLAGGGRRAALVPNALDGASEADRAAGLERDLADLESLDLQVQVVDVLRDEAPSRLIASDIIWVRGGNVFALRKALAERKVDQLLIDLIRGNRVVYGGYSAGCAVLAEDLSELSRVDDPSAIAEPVLTGLAILDRPFVPHVRSPNHPESRACDSLSALYAELGQEHWALSDGEVLVVDDDATSILRPAETFMAGRDWSSPAR